MSTFNLLSKSLQRKIWDMKWESFTPIQDQAIPAILQRSHDVIIAAGTASGKTEAAFLPILTAVEDSAKSSLKVLYISPLKALINNQFDRIEKLCENMGVSIHRWHGDVSANKKQKIIKDPTGILQITPESLESLFINKTSALETIFSEVEFIIIDEIHSFIDIERGVHLRSLLSRIDEFAKIKPRILGLSATINNLELVKKWINLKQWESVEVLEDRDSDKTLLYYLMYFNTDSGSQKPIELFEDIRELTKEDKAIIFCNSRADVEDTTVMLNQLAGQETYYAHHSSIDKKEREYVETLMVETSLPKSVVATSSLELGIDIGDVDLVIQMDSTYSVSSLKQRLGRSGRQKGAEQVLQLYSTNKDSLLQSVAVMELLLEKWVEPATGYPLPYDVLVHQLISICAEKNGVTVGKLLAIIHKNDMFHNLEQTKVDQLILHLIDQDILEKIRGSEEIIVGIEGERLLRSRDFYTMFRTTDVYEVIDRGRKIGKIDRTPWLSENDNIMLSGKMWTITSLDKGRNKCHVQPAVNGNPPKYSSGTWKIHEIVGEKMIELLCSHQEFEYMDPHAHDVLQELRQPYHLNEINPTDRVLWQGHFDYIFETFTSTKMTLTISWMMKLLGAKVQKCDSLGRIFFEYAGDVSELTHDLKNFSGSVYDVLEMKKEKSDFNSKYSDYLPQDLKDEIHIQHELDLDGALRFLNEVELRII